MPHALYKTNEVHKPAPSSIPDYLHTDESHQSPWHDGNGKIYAIIAVLFIAIVVTGYWGLLEMNDAGDQSAHVARLKEENKIMVDEAQAYVRTETAPPTVPRTTVPVLPRITETPSAVAFGYYNNQKVQQATEAAIEAKLDMTETATETKPETAATPIEVNQEAAETAVEAKPGETEAAIVAKPGEEVTCTKVSTDSKHIACDDADLAKIDIVMNGAYSSARSRVINNGKLEHEQHEWSRNTHIVCKDKACILNAYSQRVSALAQPEP